MEGRTIKGVLIVMALSKIKIVFGRRKIITQLLVGSVIVVGGYLVYQFLNINEGNSDKNNFTAVAEKIVGICTQEDHKPACYDREIPFLMDQGFTMEETFDVTRVIQKMDRSYTYCHVLGHYLSAKETAKDPEKWKDVVARAPLGMCSNGAIHGAFQERFRVESMPDSSLDYIERELDGVCEPREGWQPTRMGQATCVHALGHLTMYVTEADIHDSLALCGRLIPESDRISVKQLCYDGAFMQIYQPLEPEDFALIAGKEIKSIEASKEFCQQFEAEALGSCTSESWPLYKTQIKDPAKLTEICAPVFFDENLKNRCVNGMFYVAMAQANLSLDWAKDFCSKMSEEYRGRCFGNSASRLIEVDSKNIEDALDLCEFSNSVEGVDGQCYDELLTYSGYTFLVGSEEFFQLCNGLPETMAQLCLNQKPVSKI